MLEPDEHELARPLDRARRHHLVDIHAELAVPVEAARWGSILFLVALISMPTCCFLTAWRQPLRPLDEYPALAGSLPVVQADIEAMRAEGAEARADATAFLQGDLAAHRWLAIPLVLAGAVPLLDENERASSLRLSRLSAAVLAQVADCNCGVAAVLRRQAPPLHEALLRPLSKSRFQ